VFPHSAVQCLTAIAQHYGIPALPERLIHDYALTEAEPETKLLIRMASELGLKARARTLAWNDLAELEGVFPLLARLEEGQVVIIAGLKRLEAGSFEVAVLDPLVDTSRVRLVSETEFCRRWRGEIIFVKRRYRLTDENQPFGLRWFIPEILKQRAAFRDIALAAATLHFLGLASPIFTQLVIDKVLVHESYSTLYVLTIGIVIALLFEAAFGFLRQYLLLIATNKIDIRLARRTFAHLLSLPIEYFESTTAGVTVQHMQQISSIRGFLTGQLFFTVLEATALFVFVPLLFLYSVKLTCVVLVISSLMAAVVIALIKPFQQRLSALYQAEGLRQSMLVEAIHGIRTIKAMAIEPKQRKVWDQRSADSVSMHYNVGKMGLAAVTVTHLLEKLMTVAIIGFGATDVFSHEMTMGTLIAFQMLSGRVVGPLVQIVGLVNQYQQTALSVKMLGNVMNRAPERKSSGGLRPRLAGRIDLDGVTFRYPGSTIPALDRISFEIPAGSVVGIVGRSGSGKTTLTKLIQSMYPVQEGVIRFDGVDMREIDLAHLRRSIGVVLQENFMFRGTIRDNIAVTKPDASFEEVVAAAQAAGADEFIERLPQGYDTVLEENASNLSGGQRQRLSIARAILPQPRILILDEAASALDPDSEAIFMANLSRIAAGKTVVIISHRLSTLVNADKILVFERGRLADAGRHQELLSRCSGYAHLWHQQTSYL
jgi:subfamily B ATP-binding cassette protein HlyB/CyaB